MAGDKNSNTRRSTRVQTIWCFRKVSNSEIIQSKKVDITMTNTTNRYT